MQRCEATHSPAHFTECEVFETLAGYGNNPTTGQQQEEKMKQMNQRDAIHHIATRQEFKASALTGKYKDYTPSAGRLDREEYAKLIEASASEKFIYAVYSYDTPIAWHTSAQGWYVVAQKFSVTTSKHQNFIRRAIAESLQGVN